MTEADDVTRSLHLSRRTLLKTLGAAAGVAARAGSPAATPTRRAPNRLPRNRARPILRMEAEAFADGES